MYSSPSLNKVSIDYASIDVAPAPAEPGADALVGDGDAQRRQQRQLADIDLAQFDLSSS